MGSSHPILDFVNQHVVATACIAIVVYWLGQAVRESMRESGRRAKTITARVGLVLDWLCTATAVPALGLGAYAAYNDPNEGWMWGGILVGIAVAIWLLGKALRFILAGMRSEEPALKAAGSEGEK